MAEAIDKAELKRKQRAEKDARKAERRAEKEARKHAQLAERESQRQNRALEQAQQAFWSSPAGQARRAFADGDHVFQFNVDVLNQEAIIVAMVGSTTSQKHADPTAILNLVCREGWELLNGDFVFLTTGHQSRDKFMSSGQNVAIKGAVMGYYLFKRCEANRVPETEAELQARLSGEPASGTP